MSIDLMFGGIGVLLVALGIPLAVGRIGPNRWYGFRLPATLRDQQIWYAANARAGRDLIATGILLLVFVLVIRQVGGLPPNASALACSVALMAGAMVTTIRGYRLTNRLVQAPANMNDRDAG